MRVRVAFGVRIQVRIRVRVRFKVRVRVRVSVRFRVRGEVCLESGFGSRLRTPHAAPFDSFVSSKEHPNMKPSLWKSRDLCDPGLTVALQRQPL